jgi:excisionase family DNA binding protein
VDNGWLSVQEAADRCGVTYRTIYRMVKRGELAAEKPDGRPYRLRRSDVDAFIERSKVKPGQLFVERFRRQRSRAAWMHCLADRRTRRRGWLGSGSTLEPPRG